MGALNDLARNDSARNKAGAPDARRSWDEVEARYREECAAMLRDARRHFEQRAAREQTTIENVLAAFERDFDAWLDRERRGISSPKPSLATLFEIWLERGSRRFDSPSASPETPLRQEAAAEARALALQQRLDEERWRIEELERRLADAESRSDSHRAEIAAPTVVAAPALALAAPRSPRSRRGAALLATLVCLATLFGAAQLARRSQATPLELRAALARLDAFTDEMEARARSALGRLAAGHAREEALETLLAENKADVIARAVSADPQLARAEIEALAPRQNEPAPTPPPEPPARTTAAPTEAATPEPAPPQAVAAAPQQAALEAEPTLTPQEEAERLSPAIIGPKLAAFRGFDNRDVTGAALATLRKLDQSACVAACRSRANCAGYSFDRWNHVCRLKTNIGAFALNPRMTSGLRDGMRIPRAPSGALTMERYPSKAFPGSGYRTATAEGPEACETACREEDACVAFTFRLDEGACHLFKTTGEYFSNELADSGGKRQD